MSRCIRNGSRTDRDRCFELCISYVCILYCKCSSLKRFSAFGDDVVRSLFGGEDSS